MPPAGGVKSNICAKIGSMVMVRGTSVPRPVLLTLAVLFAAATILYSANCEPIAGVSLWSV